MCPSCQLELGQPTNKVGEGKGGVGHTGTLLSAGKVADV